MLERDIRYRAGLVAVGGWQLAIDGMGRNVRWIPPDSIQFSLHQNPDLFATDDGLVFVPHTAQRGRWTCEAPPRLAMVYPGSRGRRHPERADRDAVAHRRNSVTDPRDT